MTTTEKRLAVRALISESFGSEYNSADLLKFAKKKKVSLNWMFDAQYRIGRGRYRLPSLEEVTGGKVAKVAKKAAAPVVAPVAEPIAMADNVVKLPRRNIAQEVESLIPRKGKTYVPFGNFSDVKSIISAGIFFPVFITGLSGNGKTEMVEQACAATKREMIRVNITEETDEADLIGAETLVDGSIFYREGPVLTAMRRGAILLLDEVDLNATKVLCLQSIMEGKPYFIKKTGEMVYPAPGFNIFATANTKGRGAASGKFVGTKFMNEAFLERFAVTIEQDYPSAKIEKKMLDKVFAELGVDEKEADKFGANLTLWAEAVRKAYNEEVIEDVISTRRLVVIAKTLKIFGDRLKAVSMCISRFDSDTKTQLLDLYTKVDAEAKALSDAASSAAQNSATNPHDPF